MPVLGAGGDEDDVAGMEPTRLLPPFLAPAFPVGAKEDLPSPGPCAMDALYLKKELRSIYLKDVTEMTRISRTAIYSYYRSKEEILLDSLYNHFVELDDGLERLVGKGLSKEGIISSIAGLLEENVIILKIMSCDLEDIERSSSLENLVVLKGELKRFQTAFRSLARECGREKDADILAASFITMMYGYYPIAYPIDVQREAMRRTGTEIGLSLREIIVGSLGLLLG